MRTLMLCQALLLLGLLAVALHTHVATQDRIAGLEREIRVLSRQPEGRVRRSDSRARSVARAVLARLGAVEQRLTKLEQAPEDRVTAAQTPPAEVRPPVEDGRYLTDAERIDAIATHFDLYDLNRDALLEEHELSSIMPDPLELDLNGDRRIGRDEAERLQELANNARAHARSLDATDGSFPIARRDYRGSEQLFSFLDRDGDGVITQTEHVTSSVKAVKEIRRFDLDYNGALTAAELWDAPTRFAATDLDKDGLVYAWEVARRMARNKW